MSNYRATSRRQAMAERAATRRGPRLGEEWGQDPHDWWLLYGVPADYHKRSDEELVPESVQFIPHPTFRRPP